MSRKEVLSRIQEIKDYIKQQMTESEGDTVLVGVTGGLNSSVVLKCAVRAIGMDNVKAVVLKTMKTDMKLIEDLINDLGVKSYTFDIEDAHSGLIAQFAKEFGTSRIDDSLNLNIVLPGNLSYIMLNSVKDVLLGSRTCNCEVSIEAGKDFDISPVINYTEDQLREISEFFDLEATERADISSL